MFGQPPRQNLFPGACGTGILEEDVENILENEDKGTSDHSDADPSPDAGFKGYGKNLLNRRQRTTQVP